MFALSTDTTTRLTRSETRRRAILEATLRVIGEGGADAVTLRRVAAEAAVPLGSTTYYFESREELMREAFRHYLQRFDASMTALRGEYPATPDVDQLAAFFIELNRRQLQDRSLLRAEYELILFAIGDAVLAADLHAWEDRLLGQIAQPLEALGAQRPFDAARVILHLARGAEVYGLTRARTDPESLRRQLIFMMRALVSAPPDARRRD
jgi:DNA-binding transcriptional regulator YbjK